MVSVTDILCGLGQELSVTDLGSFDVCASSEQAGAVFLFGL